MSWDWAGLLAVGALAAGSFAWLTSGLRRENERVKRVRAEVAQVRSRARRRAG